MEPNKELLKATLDRINALPAEYDQNSWVKVEEANVCGTTMCFAGHAAILAGAEVPDPKKHEVADWFVTPGGEYLNWKQIDKLDYDAYQPIAHWAADKLGLTYEQHDYLFDGDRTKEEIEEAVDELITYGTLTIPSYDYDDDYDDYDYDDYCDCGECN